MSLPITESGPALNPLQVPVLLNPVAGYIYMDYQRYLAHLTYDWTVKFLASDEKVHSCIS